MTYKVWSPDETGKRYGKLTVLRQLPSVKIKGKHKNIFRSFWECRCDCGNIVERLGRDLRRAKNPSCGCATHLANGEAAFNALYTGYRNSAKTRGVEWGLNKDDFRAIVSLPCFYCGKFPSQVYKQQERYGAFTYNGVDRVNNSIGYVSSNVVPCCGQCNTSKRHYTESEFRQWVQRVYEHWAKES